MKFDLVINASRKASNFLIRDFNEIGYFKNSSSRVHDFIAKAKIRTKDIVLGELERYFPDHAILSRQDAKSEPEGNYIVFDPLEGAANMENLLPFFAVTIMLSTQVKNTVVNMAVVNMPVMDHICYTATGQSVWVENYQGSYKKKGSVSAVSKIVVSKEINDVLLKALEAKKIEQNLLRCFGSSSYATVLLANGGAEQYASENNDWLAEKITSLIAENAGAKTYSQDGMNFYTAQKTSNNKTLRLAK
jgi:fructose-1,6-bisphosphatase/inositol monophosphatase family enzyme